MRYFLIILTILSFGKNSHAHQDKYFTYEFDNVKVRFLTGFKYEEINNARIIGQYAALLCDELLYDKPILLDFIHDYGNNYKGENFCFINIGSEIYNSISYYDLKYDSIIGENVAHMVPYSTIKEKDLDRFEKHTYATEPIDSLEKIVIRQFGFHFEVKNTLKYLQYAINNQNEINKFTQKDTLFSYLPNMYYELNSIPRSKIDSIKTIETKNIEKIINKKIYAQTDTNDRNRLLFSYYAKDNRYSVFASLNDNEIVLDTLNQIYSLDFINDYWQALFVFDTPNSFKSYNRIGFGNEFKTSKRHKIPIEIDEFFVLFIVNWIAGDIFFVNACNRMRISPCDEFPYLMDDDILITDFETYIESKRKN